MSTHLYGHSTLYGSGLTYHLGYQFILYVTMLAALITYLPRGMTGKTTMIDVKLHKIPPCYTGKRRTSSLSWTSLRKDFVTMHPPKLDTLGVCFWTILHLVHQSLSQLVYRTVCTEMDYVQK